MAKELDSNSMKKPRVWMRKSDAQIVEYFPTILGGYAISTKDMTRIGAEKIMIGDPECSITFDDDEEFDSKDFVDLGDL